MMTRNLETLALCAWLVGCEEASTTPPGPTDTSAPTLVGQSPGKDATAVALDTTITATFSEPVDPLQLRVIVKAGTAPMGGSVEVNGATVTFRPGQPLNESLLHTVFLDNVEDLAGNNIAATPSWTFTTLVIPDSTPPTIVTVSPPDGATGVALNTTVQVTFSEGMNGATINATSFTLFNGGSQVTGAVTLLGTVATFTPAPPLALQTTYTATITTEAQDRKGNALGAQRVWTFTTMPDTTAPYVVSTVPTNFANAISPTVVPRIVFSERMNPATVISRFSLLADGSSVAGTVSMSADGTTAYFTPTARLAFLSSMTGRLAAGAQDFPGGNAIATLYTWTFTINEFNYTSQTLDFLTGTVANLSVGIDAAGSTTALWTQPDTGVIPVRVRARQRLGVTWLPAGTATDLSGSTETVASAHFARSASGSGMAVWAHTTLPSGVFLASRYDAVSDLWSAPQPIDALTEPSSGTRVTLDAAGNGVATWVQGDGSSTWIWAARYLASGGWQAASQLGLGQTGAVGAPDVALDPSGNSIVVWTGKDNGTDSIFYSWYTSGGAWGAPTLVETTNDDIDEAPRAIFASDGTAFVAWSQEYNTPDLYRQIFVRHSNSSGSFLTVAQAYDYLSSLNAVEPVLAADGNGNAFLAWRRTNGNLGTARYAFGAWGSLTNLTGFNFRPAIGADRRGNAMILSWNSGASLMNLHRFNLSTLGWSNFGGLFNGTGSAQLSVAPDGRAAAIFPANTSTDVVVANFD